MQEIKITQFDTQNICDNSSNLIIGSRGSGKSWLVRDLLQKLHTTKIFDEISVVSPTDRMTDFYSGFLPKENVYFEFNVSLIAKILEKQSKNKKNKVAIVLDDCLSSSDWWSKDKTINELFFNSRYYNITLFVTMQFPFGLKPEIRCNFDYVFLFKDVATSKFKRCYEHYCGIFPTFEKFREVFESTTENFKSLVIVQRGIQLNFNDKIKHYKSNDTPDFKIENVCEFKNEKDKEKEKDDYTHINFFDKNSEKEEDTEENLESNTTSNMSINDFKKITRDKTKSAEKIENEKNVIKILHTIANTNDNIVNLLSRIYE